MPQYCCVPGCKENRGGHIFPKDPEMRLKWRIAIKRLDETTKKLWAPGVYDVVCHKHFSAECYNTTILGEKKRLKKDAVPTIFDFSPQIAESALRRRRRYDKKRLEEAEVPQVEKEIEISTTSTFENCEEEMKCKDSRNASVQCSLLNGKEDRFSIESLRDNDKAIQYYTGFEDFDHFMIFFHILGPAAYNLKYRCNLIEPEDQLLLTLMKLRQAKEDLELSFLFKVSESTVSTIVVTWIHFMYFQLKEIDLWPSRELIDEYMPEDFGRKFGTTRVILDATEIPILKPSNVEAQSMTFSSYKHKNTLKTIIGCTPRGLVSFVSDTYGGSVSDRQIVERSELCKNNSMFVKKDSIMADRGIMVQDLFASKDVAINTPTLLKGTSQLEPEEVCKDRRIASKRIHIERVIGLSKRFKILTTGLPPSKLNLSARVIFICFAISNFRRAIVDQLA